MVKVYIVEDDEVIRDTIRKHLSKWGFEIGVVEDFNNILQEFLAFEPQLVILDVNLPFFDGFYWCNQIREVSNVPIIFLSSRNSRMDQIMGMNMGADYYIEKPVDLDVLMARINALLRRTYSYADLEEANVMEHNNVFLYIDTNTLTHLEDKIELTKNEFLILYELMKQKGSIVSRDEIMRALWEDESFVDDNTLTVNVVRIRKKLAEIGLDEFIKTKKGQGYMIE
ncbi:two-component system response regulator VirR [Listeria welshimeri]|uniref:two-component system response regulator VirR n=1 Tax=Listeria welshimeri TaxID=1643 RepID=UPI0016268BCB|nr:two-component system response regulator VirR [Listeria welshimeri]MBC1478794.1 response regulator transcription factor [Listeria welshimeri]MBC1982139.1 response regulator transcription factor [Listeria welshimeri]MBF2342464.1 two-component system response regulator VirR [Listeria welshimeri]MBF2424302.1 two-component system response regulator VirR [Listeria welshimeri]MBF2429868.1 two-component system response regulator VirR [Listeria welshimeri]